MPTPREASTSPCPDRNTLQAFLRDDLPASDSDRLAEHVNGCTSCLRLLKALDEPLPAAVVIAIATGAPPPEGSSDPGQPTPPPAAAHPTPVTELPDDAAPGEARAPPAAATGWPATEVPGAATPGAGPTAGPAEVAGYELLGELGRGGMGVVYKARDPRLGRHVAIKFLKAEYAGHPERLERFEREARTASALNHPYICTVHQAGLHHGQPFIVMELIEGRTLRELTGQRLPVPRLARLFAQAAQALGAAHAAGVVHRDVKPDNLMVRDDGYIKVVDFGLARIRPASLGAGPTGPGTEPGLLVGTPHYMSPEQARGEALDSATDVFALGVTLYELATGQHPFAADSWPAVLHAIQALPAVPAARLRPDIPVALDGLLLKMLHKDARLRPTAAEVAAGLDALAMAGVPGGERGDPARRHTVGRQRERQALRAALAAAAEGRGLFVCVTGEPGLGKTTLVEDFLAELADGRAYGIARGRCSERLAGAEAYLPFLEALEDLTRGPGGEAAARFLKAAAPTWHAQLAAADDPAAGGAADAARAFSQERLKRELVAFLQELAGLRPVVLFFDDMHWADASTVALLAYLGGKCAALRLLVVLTYRPSEMRLRQHPFLQLQLELQGHSRCREVALGFLSRPDVEQYLALEFPGYGCPGQLVDLILGKTEGNPLFMADLLRYLRDRGTIAEVQGQWGLTRALEDLAGELPESVRSMVQKKIDRLSESDRRLLMAASVQGHEFDSAVVARVLGLEAAEVEERLEVLERVHVLVRCLREQEFPDRTLTVHYAFVHVLYQNSLYAALRPTRKAQLSAAAAQVLLGFYAARSAEVAAELAFLFEAGRDPARAAEHFLTAARNAADVFAYHEAEALAHRGLEQLRALPETTERVRKELQLQTALAGVLQPRRGYDAAETGEAYRRARALCLRLGDEVQVPELFLTLWGLWNFHMMARELATALDLAEELSRLAQRGGDPVQLMQAHLALQETTLHQGKFPLAMEHFRAALAESWRPCCRAARPYGLEPEAACRCTAAWALWPLGYPDQALECVRQALTRVREVRHPPTLCYALLHLWNIHQRRGEERQAQEGMDEMLALADEHGFLQYLAMGTFMRGWSQAALGKRAEGIAQMRQGLKAMRATGSGAGQLRPLSTLAAALGEEGLADEAQAVLDEALAAHERTGEHYYEADLYRVQGELLLARRSGGPAVLSEAERWFRRAVEVARRQQAKSLELRAVVGLSRLYHRQGRREEVRPLLAQTYGWFTEGLDTADLREAAALLQELP
jgi:predicted ATPase/predicted Ser/Thr protein kinase